MCSHFEHLRKKCKHMHGPGNFSGGGGGGLKHIFVILLCKFEEIWILQAGGGLEPSRPVHETFLDVTSFCLKLTIAVVKRYQNKTPINTCMLCFMLIMLTRREICLFNHLEFFKETYLHIIFIENNWIGTSNPL